MYHLRLVGQFARASVQNELAYRANFWISLLHSSLGLITGVLGLVVVFGQVETIRGWDLPSTLALLGVYQILAALRGLFIGPSLEALAGMDGEIWTGNFDFTLLRPVDAQFLASVRHWRPFALIDLVLGLGVLVAAVYQLATALSPLRLVAFLLTSLAAVTILYALQLAFSALTLWNPGFLFTWVLDGLFNMARYPVGLYPGWLRIVLTWLVPVGIMTTVPAQALTGTLPPGTLAGSLGAALVLLLAASALFRFGLRRYASASS
ncbi:MAG: ABC-2 family transporter protein [Anaerolineae bacterium]|nr:ABC-2 family transporter protein [Anaerolineae bacterium]